jgi:predicted permease
MDRLLQDLRYAWASSRRRPAFAATVVLTIALGIGANTSIFALFNAVMLRPLDIPDADRLVQVFETNAERGGDASNVAFLNVSDLLARSASLESLGVFTPVDRNLAYGEYPERVQAALATGTLFDVLGMHAVRGRLLADADTDGPAVALLSESYWRNRLGSDEAVVGTELRINGEPAVVVGIVSDMPAMEPFDLFQPLPRIDYVTTRTNHFLTAIGRLEPSTTLVAAAAEASDIGLSLQAALPGTNAGWNFLVVDLQSSLVGDTWIALALFLGVVAGVLVIVCVNVTNLMLVRAGERSREIAVRGALGASRRRILRQLMTESLLLSGLGGALGIAFAYAALEGFRGALPVDVPGLRTASIDVTVLGFAVAVSVLTGVLFGSAPAWRATGRDVIDALRDGASTTSSSRAHSRARRALVVIEVATAVLLLTVAGTFLQTISRSLARDPGFEASRVTTMRIEPPQATHPRESLPQLVAAILDATRALPGVEEVAATTRIPLGRSATMRGYKPADAPDPEMRDADFALWTSATPDYFEALTIRMLSGRPFAATDTAAATPVVIINETMALRAFGRTDVVGEQVHIWTDEAAPRTVIGVTSNARTASLFDASVPPEYYTPFAQSPMSRISLVIRAIEPGTDVASGARAALRRIDAQLPIFDVRTMEGVIAADAATPRTVTSLLLTFAATALGLALFGLYGVVSYAVTRRHQELGIRLALGASQAAVRRLVVFQGLRMALLGTVVGLATAAAATQTLATSLNGLLDPSGNLVTWGAIAILALATTAAASYLPARRASRVDPLAALRDA